MEGTDVKEYHELGEGFYIVKKTTGNFLSTVVEKEVSEIQISNEIYNKLKQGAR